MHFLTSKSTSVYAYSSQCMTRLKDINTTFTLRTVCQNRSRTVHRTVLKRVHTYTNRTGSQRKKGRSEYICACAMVFHNKCREWLGETLVLLLLWQSSRRHLCFFASPQALLECCLPPRFQSVRKFLRHSMYN